MQCHPRSVGIDLIVRTLPAKCFVLSSFASMMSYMALDFFAGTYGTISRLLRASSVVSLLTSMSRRIFTSDVSREIVLVVMAST